MGAKTAEQRAAERMVADYPVPILSPPVSKRTVKGPTGRRAVRSVQGIRQLDVEVIP